MVYAGVCNTPYSGSIPLGASIKKIKKIAFLKKKSYFFLFIILNFFFHTCNNTYLSLLSSIIVFGSFSILLFTLTQFEDNAFLASVELFTIQATLIRVTKGRLSSSNSIFSISFSSGTSQSFKTFSK